jgi:hypothetical protein
MRAAMNDDVGALVIAVVGVIGTLSAAVISQVLSARGRREELETQRLQRRDEYKREQDSSLLETQRQLTVEFILATDTAHGLLRDVATRSLDPAALKQAVPDAVRESGLYAVRERVLIVVPPEVAYAAEETFHSVVGIRHALERGATLRSPEYRDAYNTYSQAIWSLRQAARVSFSAAALNLGEIEEIESARRVRTANHYAVAVQDPEGGESGIS